MITKITNLVVKLTLLSCLWQGFLFGQMFPFPGPKNNGVAAPVGPNVFSTYSGTTGDNTTVTLPTVDSSGSTLLTMIITMVSGANPCSASITDNKGNTWLAINRYSDSTVLVNVCIWYSIPSSVGVGHIVSISNGHYSGIVFSGWNGPTTYTSVFNGAGGTTNQTSIATGSVTPGSTNSLVIAGWVGSVSTVPDKTSLSINTGFTIPTNGVVWNGDGGQTILGAGVAYLQETSIVSVNPTWSWTESTKIAAAIAVFH